MCFYSQKITSDKNTFKYEVDLSILNYTNVEKYYKFICDYKDFNSISFGIIIKEGENLKTLIYSQTNTSNNNDYTFLHERYFQENLELIKEENILFETDLNEIINLLNREENLIILLMRPIPMENFLSTVDSGYRLPPKVTNFLPKPPAGLVFQTLEGDI